MAAGITDQQLKLAAQQLVSASWYYETVVQDRSQSSSTLQNIICFNSKK